MSNYYSYRALINYLASHNKENTLANDIIISYKGQYEYTYPLKVYGIEEDLSGKITLLAHLDEACPHGES